MDRNYYYRILGVRSDATPQQIKAAYAARIARLNSEDYADEPEYAKRKKEQATKAYKVLTGAAPAATRAQKEARFEKRKDRIERREGFDVDDSRRERFVDDSERDRFDDNFTRKEKRKSKVSAPKINFGKRAVQSTADKAKLTVAGTALTIFMIVMGLFSVIDDFAFEDSYVQEDYTFNYEDVFEVEELTAFFDYYSMLDTSTMGTNQSKVVWDDGIDEYGGEIDSFMIDVLWWLDIDRPYEFFEYYTGYEDYYGEYDDYSCATVVIGWIGAPSFEEIAGATNLYNGEQILSLTDYMEYLEEFTYENS